MNLVEAVNTLVAVNIGKCPGWSDAYFAEREPGVYYLSVRFHGELRQIDTMREMRAVEDGYAIRLRSEEQVHA